MVYWQDMFNRAANKSNEDLIEDAKCIGNMEKIEKELDEEDKKGLQKIYTYKFSKQDFKVKENENVLNALVGDLDKNKVGKELKEMVDAGKDKYVIREA